MRIAQLRLPDGQIHVAGWPLRGLICMWIAGGCALIYSRLDPVAWMKARAIVRPIAKSHLRMPPQIRTGAAALVGKQAIVLERIANDEGVGCVKIDGEVWTARSLDEDQVIERGTRVHVIEIRGATALVAE